MARDPCVFCEIVAGGHDQQIVYADEVVVAFLCEPPATWGHVLIIPREHWRDIWTTPCEEAVATMRVAHQLAAVARADLGAIGINLRHNSGSYAGQDIFHFHLHVVPRYEGDTVQPGCVWGAPPWVPPAGGDPERTRIADAIRLGVASRRAP
jgi:histidine triad (HIT) family protein